MDLGMTVDALYNECVQQRAKGNGSKHVVISSDDEGNSFHTLFFGFTDTKEDVEYMLAFECDQSHTSSNAVILG